MSSAKRERDQVDIDSETQVPQAKRQKKAEDEGIRKEVLERLKLEEIVKLFNRKIKRTRDRFICSDCYSLCAYEPNRFIVGGKEEFYCDNCTVECEGCQEVYCKDLAHRHEDCHQEEEVIYGGGAAELVAFIG